MEKIKVLIVDDSSFIRTSLKKILDVDFIEIVGSAVNGEEAVKLNEELQPDVITLDIEMPKMNGLQALEKIMSSGNPAHVIMLSSLTQDGANSTVEALELGAVDFVGKKDAFSGMSSLKDELIEKILHVTRRTDTVVEMNRRRSLSDQKKKSETPAEETAVERLRRRSAERKASEKPARKAPATPIKPKPAPSRKGTQTGPFSINKVTTVERPSKVSLITIGISTGGPAALMKVIPKLPADLPCGILIAQHMPPHFTESLARRLDSKSAIAVQEAKDGDFIKSGNVYIAQGGKQMYLSGSTKLTISDHPIDELYKPSVDVLFDSAFKYHKSSTLGIIMTGMGHDGREAIKRMRRGKAYILAQTTETCVAPGMPDSIISNSLADEIYDLDYIADAIKSFF
jgi:two-component system chemotaxis response regulator CheB